MTKLLNIEVTIQPFIELKTACSVLVCVYVCTHVSICMFVEVCVFACFPFTPSSLTFIIVTSKTRVSKVTERGLQSLTLIHTQTHSHSHSHTHTHTHTHTHRFPGSHADPKPHRLACLTSSLTRAIKQPQGWEPFICQHLSACLYCLCLGCLSGRSPASPPLPVPFVLSCFGYVCSRHRGNPSAQPCSG